jgi:glycosyltransferase involved in cell wall biosynthesis
MRMLFVSRLMSGFADSLRTGVWQPTGAPAIARLMRALAAREPDTRFVLVAREAGFDFSAPWTTSRDVELKLQGFPAPLRVLAGAHRFPALMGRWRGHLAECRQLLILLAEIRRTQPDVIYFERGGALIAGVVARLNPGRVVLRLLGILPWMHQLAKAHTPYHRLLRWAYRAPFGLVVCSEDGSGGRSWMAHNLRPGVPRMTLLNGVDPLPAQRLDAGFLSRIPPAAVVILSLGRLEALRRLDDFLTAMLRMPQDTRQTAHVLIVGDGPERLRLESMVEAAKARDFVTFAGAQPLAGVAAALSRADIYVMLNDMCCLTNSTLEALRAGLCLVVLDPPPPVDADSATDELLPSDLAVRIPRSDHAALIEVLARRIAGLIGDPAARQARRTKAAAMAASRLQAWPARLDREIDLLQRIARGERLPEQVDG